MNQHEHEQTPAELIAIARSLDALSAHDADAARPGLEERAFEASRRAISRSAPPQVVVARIGTGRLRVAAAVVILVAGALAGAMLLRQTPHPAPTSGAAGPIAAATTAPAQTTDDETLLDSASETVDLALASLTTETATLLTELQSFSADPLSNWSASDAVQVGDSM